MAQETEIYHLDIRKALAEHFFEKWENGWKHASFEREMTFYESVRSTVAWMKEKIGKN